MQDTRVSYETPEGIELNIPVAGPLVRGFAWIIDLLIRGVIYILISIVLNLLELGNVGYGITLIILFVVEWFYPTLFEAIKGATPGKSAMGLYVSMDDGTIITWQGAVVRNLLRIIDFLPFLYITGIISTLSNSQFKRLGDLVAGTLVVYNSYSSTLLKFESSSLETSSSSTPLPILLTGEEQRTILHFNERLGLLSISRQHELANMLEPIIHCKNESAVQLLSKYATWIRGGR